MDEKANPLVAALVWASISGCLSGLLLLILFHFGPKIWS